MQKQKNMPALRFPEFEGEWERKKLGDIGVNIIDGDRGTNYPNGNDFSEEGFCLFMNAKNVTKNGFLFIEKAFITQEKDNELRKGKLKRFDLVLTTRGSVGHVAYYDSSISFEHLRINSGMVLLRANQESLNPNYLYKYFVSNFIQNVISIVAFGSAQPQLTVGEISKFKISYPSLPEQTKIANFLTVVDDRLQALKKKKNLLEQYKKGVMQKIFSQELRFRDENGNEFPDWEKKKLGDVIDNIGGTALEKHVNESGKYRFISIGNYSVNGRYIDNLQRIDLNEKTKEKLLNKNDLVMVLNDKTTAGDLIGSTILIESDDTYIYNQRSERLICRQDTSSLFLWHFLNSFSFRKELFGISQGGTQIYVNFPAVKKLGIHFPSIIEQTKIANFLSSIDDKINHCQTQIDKTEKYKNGLLQNMFC